MRLLINKGKEPLDLDYYDKALAVYTQVLLSDPDDEAQENVHTATRNILILKMQRESKQHKRVNLALQADKFFEAEFSSKGARGLFLAENCREAAKFYKQAISFNPEFEANYKERGRDLLVKCLDLYEVGRIEEAYLIYKQAILFDSYNQQVSYVRGRPLDKLKNLLREQDQIQTAETPQFVLNQIKQKEEIDYEELMLEGYDGERKIALIDNVSDTDEYDDNYNQYYEIDLEYDIDD